MNKSKRAEVIQAFLEEHSKSVMEDKGGAYSRGEENCNSNFYRVAEALGTDPTSVAWVYALKHIDALSAYVKGGCKGHLIGSEPVEGRIGDAVNYLLILYSILVQEGILGGEEDEDAASPDVGVCPNCGRSAYHHTATEMTNCLNRALRSDPPPTKWVPNAP